MRAHRLHSLTFVGLLLVVAASACNDTSGSSGIEDPALRGATVGEVDTLVADLPDGHSDRQHFLTVGGADGARLRLRFASDPEPLTTGDRIGVWGDWVGDEFHVSRHIVLPAPEETSVTSALIGSPAKP